MADTWTAAEAALLRTYVEQGRDSAEIARLFGEQGIHRTQKSIQRKRERSGWHARVAESPLRCVDNPPTLRGDALLLFDVHSPCHDAAWINRCVDLALKWGVRRLGIGGDLVDFAAFTVFARGDAYDVGQEIETTEAILRAFTACFDEVVYSAGNHEVRLSRTTDWLLPVQQAVRLFVRDGRTVFTRSHWFRVESGAERYYVEHPKNVSVHATLIPRKLASVHLCHIVAGHGHQWGMARDVSDTWWAIDAGICADPARLDYYAMQHNTRPRMQQGAVIVRDGLPYLLGPHNIAGYERMRL